MIAAAMLYLAVDLGEKRTGLAVGDDETGFVAPAGTVEIPRRAREDDLIQRIAEAVVEHGAGAIVLGLPVNMDGTEGPPAVAVRAFAARLQERCSLQVFFQDERLTSFAAEERLKRSGRTHQQKKRLRDQLAAVAILTDFLSARSRS